MKTKNKSNAASSLPKMHETVTKINGEIIHKKEYFKSSGKNSKKEKTFFELITGICKDEPGTVEEWLNDLK